MVDTVRAANFLLRTGKTNDAGEMLTELIKIYDEEGFRPQPGATPGTAD